MIAVEGVIENLSESFSVGDLIEGGKTLSLFEKVSIIVTNQTYGIIKIMNNIAFFTSDRDIILRKSIPKQRLTQLYTKEYTLLKPIIFDGIDIIDGLFYIYNKEYRISGSGTTILEAKEEAADMLINIYEYYNKSNRKKSKEVLELLEKLNRIIKKKD